MLDPSQPINLRRAYEAIRARGSKSLIVVEGENALRVIRLGSPESEKALRDEIHKVAGVFCQGCTLGQLRDEVNYILNQREVAA